MKFLLLLAATTPALALGSAEYSRPGTAALPQERFPLVVPEPFPLWATETAEFSIAVGKRVSELRIQFTVTEDEDSGLYRYEYLIENASEWTLGFGWLALDRITGSDNMLLLLKPGEKRLVTVLHEKIPVRATAPCKILIMIDPATDPGWKKDIDAAGADTGGPFFHTVGGTVTGPVPLGTK